MKPDTQCECINDKCRTVIIGNRKYMDGLKCPRCNGPVIPKPYRAFWSEESKPSLTVGPDISEPKERHTNKSLQVEVNITKLEIFQQINQVIRDVIDDERVPDSVKNDVMDKVNRILGSCDT